MALLELRGLRREFPAGEQTIAVLKDVDLSIEQGEMVAIIGASGSGKSTLMNILGCLDRPSAGTYRVGGREKPVGVDHRPVELDIEVTGHPAERLTGCATHPHRVLHGCQRKRCVVGDLDRGDDRVLIDIVIDARHQLGGDVIGDTDHGFRRVVKIIHRNAFAQKFRIAIRI